ncbi:MAG: carboxypeptidase-like regulatory domain-containing protein, partial [Candidatus Sericytochromatia bacterium]
LVPVDTRGAAPAAPDPIDAPAAPAPGPAGERSGGSGGGSASGPVAISGLVRDAAGRPLAGVTISGGTQSLQTGPDGRFVVSGGEPLLTASLAGYVSQASGPPYQFTLRPQATSPGAPFTVSGMTDPPAPGASVVYADGAGTRAGGHVASDGSFSLTVTPADAEVKEGLLVVHQGLSLPTAERYRVLQAGGPRLGAMALSAGAAPVTVAMGAPSGEASLAPTVPAGLSPAETVIAIEGPGGAQVPLVGGEGPWPAQVPVFAAPGLRMVIALAADTDADDGRSVVELVDPAAGALLAPDFMAPPTLEPPAPKGKGKGLGRLKWRGGPTGHVAVFAKGYGRPAWEAEGVGSELELPELDPSSSGYEVVVRVESAGGRRYAFRRADWISE